MNMQRKIAIVAVPANGTCFTSVDSKILLMSQEGSIFDETATLSLWK